ncbi:transglycosylase SLT domain-containing protein [Nocardia vinacea]|uniref:transglycosylase SLT domain-containing protein n=1 Tax=Nocardia vinacea TaxID=96468 RepID=UPI002E118B12|nr:transglycosylase SLT domain-containing protein [Nocardia vinacea]
MTLTIDDVAKWEPDHLTTAANNAAKLSTDLDTAIRKGTEDTAELGTDKTWSGVAAAAANTRMETEKTRASVVSQAVHDLQTAFTAEVGNLNQTKQNVLSLRDLATNPTSTAPGTNTEPGFHVAADGTVDANDRIAWYKANLNESEANRLTVQAALDAAHWQTQIVNALAAAEAAADRAGQSVDQAVKKLQTAYDGLGDPAAVTPQTQNTSTTATSTTSTSNTSKPSYVSSNHNGSGSGSPSSSLYSGGTSSSAPTGAKPSGDMAKWIEDAKKALIAMGYDPKDIDENAIALIIQHESAGDPYAENRWDSNWVAGHPSKGLMQTIDSTFNAYKAPGHDDIWNPVDNIIAGVRYSIDTYGSLGNVPGVAAVNSGGAYRGY